MTNSCLKPDAWSTALMRSAHGNFCAGFQATLQSASMLGNTAIALGAQLTDSTADKAIQTASPAPMGMLASVALVAAAVPGTPASASSAGRSQ